jgi:hypothetical protein
VNIDNSSPAQDCERFLLFRRPLAGRAVRQNDSADTKKARFTANSLCKSGNECPVQWPHATTAEVDVYDIAMHHLRVGDRIP